ncbi:MAG: AsmA family protein [Rhodospirillales bacterium]|nr:AsmA family protein [Rhodospirillales bacterium]
MATVRLRPWHYVVAALLCALVVLVAVWDWDWFIPPVERIASARLGRPAHIQHLHVRIARNPVLEADGVVVDNPPGFAAPGPFARIARLAVTVNGPAYLHGRVLIVPSIEVDTPDVNATALPNGRNNWTFPFSGVPAGGKSGSGAKIGYLRIADGHVHAVDPRLQADFHLDIATREPGAGPPAQVVVQAHGTYAGQPISGQFVGGALLTLRDESNPYPIDLALANGATHVLLRGTVQDPLAFAGTNLKVNLSGDSLASLTPLLGVPAPATPPFRLTGDVTYADRHIRLEHLAGQVGNSDLEGDIAVDPGTQRFQVAVDLHSRQVDLADFAGMIGATPGRATTAGETPQQRAEAARASAGPWLIPHTPFDLPRLQAADMTLHYRGDHIEGKFIPLDDLTADVTIKDGAVHAHPVSFGVGRGRIFLDITADEVRPHELHARTEADFRNVDLARLMRATHMFGGGGRIGGHALVDGTGGSISGILGHGNGDLKLFMTGGDLSALLVDLSGLEFGNALLSGLGLPKKKTEVRCLVADFALRDGMLDTRTLLLDTGEANVTGKGSVNLREEVIDYQLRTHARHFTIGSLPTPIDITGHLKNPTIRPDAKDLAARGALAAGLGVLLTPLAALLPTIQLGLGEDNDCGQLIRSAQGTPGPADAHGAPH